MMAPRPRIFDLGPAAPDLPDDPRTARQGRPSGDTEEDAPAFAGRSGSGFARAVRLAVPAFARAGSALFVSVLCASFASSAVKAAAPSTSPQWVDVTQAPYDADPTDSTDSTTAINASIAAAIAGGQPLYLPYGTYKVTSEIVVDFAGVSAAGFRIISDGATLDGRAIASGPVLQVAVQWRQPKPAGRVLLFQGARDALRRRLDPGLCFRPRQDRFLRRSEFGEGGSPSS